MKKLMTFAFVLMLSTASFAASGAHVLVTVNGLVCDFCDVSMKKTFMKKEPVEAVDVNLTTKVVRIDLKPGRSLDDAEIRKGIADAGYSVVSIRRD